MRTFNLFTILCFRLELLGGLRCESRAAILLLTSTKSQFPSMKRAEIMDGRTNSQFPSMKRSEIMDDRTKSQFPSMKKGEIMDGRTAWVLGI